MNNLSALPVFVTVVKLGSFSKAAAELKITTSAVSKRINQLEQDLDVRLLNRTTRSLTLTEMGKVVNIWRTPSSAWRNSKALTAPGR